jgi:predicted CoA-substrate-specific enzyme activase
MDIGSMTAKCVLIRGEEMLSSAIIPTDSDPGKAGRAVFDAALTTAGIDEAEISRRVGTGYGRVSLDMFDLTVTELSCHARGVHWLDASIEGIIDIGGQDSKAIRLKPDGTILDFILNDRCAAGTGRFLEAMASTLKIDLTEIGSICTEAKAPCAISSTCVVFAESEIISLLAAGNSRADIAAGLMESIARRVGTMARRLGLGRNLAFVGGGAKNPGVRLALEHFLGVPFIPISGDPQLTGALGAALIAADRHSSEQEAS